MAQDRPVYVDARSRYCFTPAAFVATWLADNMARTGVIEVGPRNAIALEDVAAHIGSRSTFEGVVDHQEIRDTAPDCPDVRDVLAFAAALRSGVDTAGDPGTSR